MKSPSTRSNAGLTRVELLIVVALTLASVGVAVPAIAKVRDAANRARCADNLRVIGHGVLEFESAHGFFPSSVQNSGPQRSWAVMVLPWIGAEETARRYDYSHHWCEPPNTVAIGKQIATFYCPATPATWRTATGPVKLKYLDGRQTFYTVRDAACTDYASVDEVKQDPFIAGVCDTRGYGVLKEDQFPREAEVSDGLSNTITLIESAGRPDVWVMGKLVTDATDPDMKLKHVSSAPWASRSNDFGLDGYDPSGVHKDAGPCAINCTNNNEAYGFHVGGAYAVCADGSVRFIRDTVTTRLFARLVTRAGGEMVDWSEY